MKSYYEQDGITLFLGDAREIAPSLWAHDAIITDPVWPNAVETLAGADDPLRLLTETLDLLALKAPRVVLQLGCDSDPRILTAVPPAWPFFRACSLEYCRPHYKGRLLYPHDVAYVFGDPPASRPGRHVIPGRCLQNDAAKKPKGHPCPRQLQHVEWLVKWLAGGSVLDPFAGTGTTLLAAKNAGLPAVGVEINERFCEIAAKRLAQGVLFAGGVA